MLSFFQVNVKLYNMLLKMMGYMKALYVLYHPASVTPAVMQHVSHTFCDKRKHYSTFFEQS